jgi:hypothetical protein
MLFVRVDVAKVLFLRPERFLMTFHQIPSRARVTSLLPKNVADRSHPGSNRELRRCPAILPTATNQHNGNNRFVH